MGLAYVHVTSLYHQVVQLVSVAIIYPGKGKIVTTTIIIISLLSLHIKIIIKSKLDAK